MLGGLALQPLPTLYSIRCISLPLLPPLSKEHKCLSQTQPAPGACANFSADKERAQLPCWGDDRMTDPRGAASGSYSCQLSFSIGVAATVVSGRGPLPAKPHTPTHHLPLVRGNEKIDGRSEGRAGGGGPASTGARPSRFAVGAVRPTRRSHAFSSPSLSHANTRGGAVGSFAAGSAGLSGAASRRRSHRHEPEASDRCFSSSGGRAKR